MIVQATSPTEPLALIEVEPATGRITVLRRTFEAGIGLAYLSTSRPIEFPTKHGLAAYGLYYPPTSREHEGPPGERPPLLVKSHGSPTSPVSTVLSLEIQFWTSRGFAVLAVLGPRATSNGWNDSLSDCARRIGRWGAENGWTVACGGLSGAGQAAVSACRKVGGLTIAVTPGNEDESGAEIVIRTRLGVYRNFVLAHAADAAIAVGGGAGRLQEPSRVHELGRPLAAIGVEWRFPGLVLGRDFDDLTTRFLAQLRFGPNTPTRIT